MTDSINEELLRVVARRLSETNRFEEVEVFPANHPESVVPRLYEAYYPEHVREARLDVRAYLNGDFHVTYLEDWGGDRWHCRWDRHENPHNSRDHFHPPPNATTDKARDESFPTDFFDVIALVLEYVEERLGEVWSEYK
jgi:hypothetical protein